MTVDRRIVACHEAGHVLQYSLEGCEIVLVELNMDGDNLGLVTPLSASTQRLTHEQHMRISLAGMAAEFVLAQRGLPLTADELSDIVDENEGWWGDWNRAWRIARVVVGEEELDAAEELRFRVFKEVLEVQIKHREKVALIATALRDKRRLSGADVKALLESN